MYPRIKVGIFMSYSIRDMLRTRGEKNLGQCQGQSDPKTVPYNQHRQGASIFPT